MSKGLHVYLDSGANIHSKNSHFFTWEEIGMTEEEWDALSDEGRTDLAREWAFNYADWGYYKDGE